MAADGTTHGLTVNAFSSLSLSPPLVMVALDRAASALQVFETSGFYAVNILREEQSGLSVRFAVLPEGRFTGVAWIAGLSGAPVLEGVLAVIECRTVQVLDTGDHRVFIGEVVEATVAEGRPLIFFQSGYTQLA